jgi:hypothetical protein
VRKKLVTFDVGGAIRAASEAACRVPIEQLRDTLVSIARYREREREREREIVYLYVSNREYVDIQATQTAAAATRVSTARSGGEKLRGNTSG